MVSYLKKKSLLTGYLGAFKFDFSNILKLQFAPHAKINKIVLRGKNKRHIIN